MNYLGAQLAKLRTARELSQEQLAAMVDVHQTTISSIERGDRYPSWRLIQKFADVFGVSVDVFRATPEPTH
jgi:transcriptional regulator with XRE-family HTH domain